MQSVDSPYAFLYRGKSEADALFNPVFLALLIRRYVEGHESADAGHRVPFVLPHIAVPLALNPSVRASLTYNISSHLGAWVSKHAGLLPIIPPYLVAIQRHVKGAVLFGTGSGLIVLDGEGFSSGEVAVAAMPPAREEADVAQCQRAARYLGRWFGKTNDPAMICAFLGVRP